MTTHQQKQIENINQIERNARSNAMAFSTVDPVGDYENDSRICLTGIHFPHQNLLIKIQKSLIDPLTKVSPEHYYYSESSLHITIKSIRVINDPSHFTKEDIEKGEKVFSEVIPNHKNFKVYFYRLLLFPHNLALIGTTDPEFDNIVFDLDKTLKKEGIPDDKKYINSRYFFTNVTLARFSTSLTREFINKVEELSKSISFDPYIVDSVSLVTANAVFKKLRIINTWKLSQ